MNPRVDVLIDPFRPLFMQRALIEVLVLAIPCGLLGTWVVTRRLAFTTHAVGHATFPALVIAVLAGWSLFATSLIAAVVLALALGWLSRRAELAAGVGVAIVLATSLALGAVLVSDISDPGVRANNLLFGSLLGIGWTEVTRTAIVAGLVVVATALAGRTLTADTFHRELARGEGLSVSIADAGLMIMIGATIAVALDAAGSLLVASLLLVPAATARLLVDRVGALHITGIAVAAFDGIAGLWIAYQLDAPPGAGIAVVAAGLFIVITAARAGLQRYRVRALRMVPS